MPRVPDLPCADCGKLMWRASTSLPEGSARCQPCRRADWQHGTRKGYRANGCRCDECRAWNREQMRAYVADRKKRDPEYRTADGGRDRSGEYAKYGYTESQRRRDERRRARKIQAPCEDFDSSEIFERDDWTCGICAEPVDPSLSWPDAMSVSLDHIEPLSLGGSHTRDNSRCAHLRCNISRGNRVA